MWKRFALWAVKQLAKAAAAELQRKVLERKGAAQRLMTEASRLRFEAQTALKEAEALEQDNSLEFVKRLDA